MFYGILQYNMDGFLLNSKKGIISNSSDENPERAYINTSKSIHVDLETEQSMLPATSVSNKIDFYNVYITERNNTKKYRLIFNLYPYMTNVLFNMCTEIVGNEGGVDCFMLRDDKELTKNGPWFTNAGREANKKLTRFDAIRDSEYSHPDIGNFTYHCGVDIFNNHFLRSNGYFSIKTDSANKENKEHFNTINNFLVYNDGKIGTYKKANPNSGAVTNTEEIKLHLFNHGNLSSFKDAFVEGLKEQNGWFGFSNRGYANVNNHEIIKNGESVPISINKCINNKNTCDFIDLYPDRTLFSFLPKVNERYNNRLEYNWDWCITYPFKKEFDGFDFFEKDKGLKAFFINETMSDENPYYYVRTICKHGLKIGDNIKISYEDDGKWFDFSAKVYGVRHNGLMGYHILLSYDELSDYIGEFYENDIAYLNNIGHMYITKVEKGIPCEYYVRKFKKIKDLKSSLNKAGFAKTIYNDPVSQLIFTDDLNIKGFKNHMGMELDEVFLTIIKRNKGWKEWYLNGETHPYYIEASHCFGDVTCGFSFEKDKGEIPPSGCNSNCNIRENKFLEEEISINDDEFYGDFVEFSPLSFNERVLENIHFRFNTAQRENGERFFSKLFSDDLINDDYDFGEGNNVDTFRSEKNTLSEIAYKMDEGYLYQPHYRVKLKEYSDKTYELYDTNLKALELEEGVKIKKGNVIGEYYFKSNIPYNLVINDVIILYYGDHYKEAYVSPKTDGDLVYFTISLSKLLKDDELNPVSIFRRNISAPDYSCYIDDGKGKRIWKEIIPEAELSTDSDIYNRPFANGAIYVNTQINFFLKRQDPDGVYLTEGVEEVKKIFNITPSQLSYTEVENNEEEIGTICGIM